VQVDQAGQDAAWQGVRGRLLDRVAVMVKRRSRSRWRHVEDAPDQLCAAVNYVRLYGTEVARVLAEGERLLDMDGGYEVSWHDPSCSVRFGSHGCCTSMLYGTRGPADHVTIRYPVLAP
jgi:hypothetical protein